MKRYKLFSLLVIIALWSILAIVIDNDILLPSFLVVIKRMIVEASNISFYMIVLKTLTRMIIGLIIAITIGVILGILAGHNNKFENVMRPIEMIFQAVPNVSYIVLSLIWLGQEKSVILVSFLVLFPIFYNSAKLSVNKIDKGLKEVMMMYDSNLFSNIINVYLPEYKVYFLNSLHQGLSLGLKVCIMAEILGQVPNSMGIKIHIARTNLDTTGVLCWTCWIIVLVLLFDLILKVFEREK